jgi:hypothetical protein
MKAQPSLETGDTVQSEAQPTLHMCKQHTDYLAATKRNPFHTRERELGENELYILKGMD